MLIQDISNFINLKSEPLCYIHVYEGTEWIFLLANAKWPSSPIAVTLYHVNI